MTVTIDIEALKFQAAAFGVDLTDIQLRQFDRYAAELIAYNENVNLTAITASDEIVTKHFVDSLALLGLISVPEGASLADVGTGAGFPGMALLIARPDLRVALMDSVNKKLDFLRQLAATLDLNPEIVHIRAEDAGRDPKYREHFDYVTARAVSQLNKLAEYCVPLVIPGGTFAPLKAPLTDEEAETGKLAAGKLGCRLLEIKRYQIPGGDNREVLIFEKRSHTPSNYPRPGAKISKTPLK